MFVAAATRLRQGFGGQARLRRADGLKVGARLSGFFASLRMTKVVGQWGIDFSKPFLMRAFLVLLLTFGSIAFTGCESADLPPRLRERFEAPQPKIREYQAEQKEVFEAARRAMKRIDFTVSRAAGAQGVIRAHSGLRSGEAFGIARQNALEVKIDSFTPGVTQVAVVVREQEESEGFRGATDIAVREHGLYGSYFAALEAELGETGEEVVAP